VIEFILMLTRDDVTVDNALSVYNQVRDTNIRFVGFKDIGATTDDLAEITRRAHQDGRAVMLEVVSTSRADEIGSVEHAHRRSARPAVWIGHSLLPVRRAGGRPSERPGGRDSRDRR
jgi:hypothetical protein